MSADVQITIALAGNPNSGKTTVFNALTGSRQRIGNWPGVTVERREGTFRPAAATTRVERLLVEPFAPSDARATGGAALSVAEVDEPAENTGHPVSYRVVDLPGIYALAASSEDEAVARDYLLSADADLVVNIVDASNIQRNLFLTLQLLEMGLPVIVVLNMMDLAEKRGIDIDVAHLSNHLGCPVIAASAIRSRDVADLKREIHRHAEVAHAAASRTGGRSGWDGDRIAYPQRIEAALSEIDGECEPLSALTGGSTRWIGLKLLEGDPWVTRRVVETSGLTADRVARIIAGLEADLDEELDIVLADAKYGFIHGLSQHISRRRISARSATEQIDRVVMNRLLALPVFLLVMYGVFWFTMSIGGAFIDFFDLAFGAIFVDGFGSVLESIGSPRWLTAILAGGIGTGIQTVATFVPIIFAMFLALSLLEDSGYMARAAYVMDRFMRSIGLPGKSFVPMMVGFGCTVPAIMGTRTLDSRRDRFTTIFMSPYMSCGARLPVYALFAAAFFPSRSGAIVLSLYVAGIAVAILTGLLLKLTLFKGTPSHFVMELPPYHAPRVRHVFGQAWQRLRLFVVRAGITITVIVTVLSVLNTLGSDGSIGHDDSPDSVLSAIGKAITPVFTPMGIDPDNWPATVGIFTGIFAKEAVVGTLNALYGQGPDADDAAGDTDAAGGLARTMVDAVRTIPENLIAAFSGADSLGFGAGAEESGADDLGADLSVFAVLRTHFSPAGAYAYLLFILLYFPCVAAMAAAIKEMGALLGWTLAAYSTLLAWSIATLYYQMSTRPSPLPVAIAIGLIVASIAAFVVMRRLGVAAESDAGASK